jgi:hypothetical protein
METDTEVEVRIRGMWRDIQLVTISASSKFIAFYQMVLPRSGIIGADLVAVRSIHAEPEGKQWPARRLQARYIS